MYTSIKWNFLGFGENRVLLYIKSMQRKPVVKVALKAMLEYYTPCDVRELPPGD